SNQDRIAEMRQCLDDKFYQFEMWFLDTAGEMIKFLKMELPETIAISLDHDLELIPAADGRLLDPGTGREVADFLARQHPSCPVIVHSSNASAALGMEMVLQDANWVTYRVCPCGDLDWIPGSWLRTMRNAIVGSGREMPAIE